MCISERRAGRGRAVLGWIGRSVRASCPAGTGARPPAAQGRTAGLVQAIAQCEGDDEMMMMSVMMSAARWCARRSSCLGAGEEAFCGVRGVGHPLQRQVQRDTARRPQKAVLRQEQAPSLKGRALVAVVEVHGCCIGLHALVVAQRGRVQVRPPVHAESLSRSLAR